MSQSDNATALPANFLGSITDHAGSVWTFTKSATGLVPALGGKATPGAASATVLALVDGAMFYRDTTARWHVWLGNDWRGTSNPLLGPTPAPHPQPQPTPAPHP